MKTSTKRIGALVALLGVTASPAATIPTKC